MSIYISSLLSQYCLHSLFLSCRPMAMPCIPQWSLQLSFKVKNLIWGPSLNSGSTSRRRGASSSELHLVGKLIVWHCSKVLFCWSSIYCRSDAMLGTLLNDLRTDVRVKMYSPSCRYFFLNVIPTFIHRLMMEWWLKPIRFLFKFEFLQDIGIKMLWGSNVRFLVRCTHYLLVIRSLLVRG